MLNSDNRDLTKSPVGTTMRYRICPELSTKYYKWRAFHVELEGGCGPPKNAEKLKLMVEPDVLRLRDSVATPDLCSIFNREPEVDLISFVDI